MFDENSQDQEVRFRNWSAQDVSRLYVAQRHFLIARARKIVLDIEIANEVVQDAFLYLLTALPDLQTETDVIRFLNWKTKMLAIDQLKKLRPIPSSDRVSFQDVLDPREEPSEVIEEAEVSAIVRLALAQIDSRHREVLVASVLEGMSNSELSRRMEVSENGLRQLQHRAKRSFRDSLVREASARGWQLSDLLQSKVSRRAVQGIIGVWILATVGTSLANPMVDNWTPVAISSQEKDLRQFEELATEKNDALTDTLDQPQPQDYAPVETNQVGFPPGTISEPSETPVLIQNSEAWLRTPSDESGYAIPEAGEVLIKEFSLALGGVSSMEAAMRFSNLEQTLVSVTSGDGSVQGAFGFNYEAASSPVQFASFTFRVSSGEVIAVPRNFHSVIEVDEQGSGIIDFAGVDFIVGDFNGDLDFLSVDTTYLTKAEIKARFTLENGNIVATVLNGTSS